jgi:hypothetical protein
MSDVHRAVPPIFTRNIACACHKLKNKCRRPFTVKCGVYFTWEYDYISKLAYIIIVRVCQAIKFGSI